MMVKRLHLKNFRNIRETCIEPGKVSFLKGANAQGKTSILESIFFLATGRSPRTTRVQELVRWGTASCKASGIFEGTGGRFELEACLGSTRQWKVNKTVVKDLSCLPSRACVVSFGPEDMQILKGSPVYRRRFLDFYLSMVDVKYGEDLRQYHRLLAHRNSLLMDIKKKGKGWDILDVLDEQLSMVGPGIMRTRCRALRELEKHAAAYYSSIVRSNEPFVLRYRPGMRLDGTCMSEDFEQSSFLKRLKECREQDIKRGFTVDGPHKDDFSLQVNGVDFRLFASQGQIRTAVVSIKMAQISLLREATGEQPILLLDDVMSELDATRRQNLLTAQGDGQVFITCTDAETVESIASSRYISGECRIFHIADGQAFPV